METAAFVSALQSGDEAAFERLVWSNWKPLFTVASRILGDEEDARDAVQETFLAAFRSLRAFRRESRVSTWLHRIVVNAALIQLRRRRRKPEESLEESPLHWDKIQEPARLPGAAPTESADKILLQREIRAHIMSCIERLPDNYRTVLLLRDIEERDLDVTAKALGTSPNAAKIRLHRARKALRKMLGDPLVLQSATAAAGWGLSPVMQGGDS